MCRWVVTAAHCLSNNTVNQNRGHPYQPAEVRSGAGSFLKTCCLSRLCSPPTCGWWWGSTTSPPPGRPTAPGATPWTGSAVQYSRVQYSKVQYSTVQYSTATCLCCTSALGASQVTTASLSSITLFALSQFIRFLMSH